jgi:hypothetical protein
VSVTLVATCKYSNELHHTARGRSPQPASGETVRSGFALCWKSRTRRPTVRAEADLIPPDPN